MSGRTHIAGGFLLSSGIILLAQKNNIPTDTHYEIAFMVTSSITALLCDVDHPDSIIGRKLWPFSFLLSFVNALFRFLAFFLPKNTKVYRTINNAKRITEHRGITHWPTTIVILSAIVAIFGFILSYKGYTSAAIVVYIVSAGTLTGMLSHVLYDCISGKVALLAPFSTYKIGIRLITTGSIVDRIFVRLTSIIIGAYFCILHH